MSDSGQPPAPPSFTWETPSTQPSPMPAEDRAMTFGEIFDRAMWIYQRGFVPLVLVAAVVQVPIAVIDALVGRQVTSALGPLSDLFNAGQQPTNQQVQDAFRNAWPSIGGAATAAALVSFIGGLFLAPALIDTVARIHRGQSVSVADAYRTALARLPTIFIGSIAVAVAVIGLLVAIILVAIVLGVTISPWILLLGFVVALVAPFWIGIRVSLWQQAVVLEEAGPIEAFRRSWSLVAGSMWRTFGLIVLTFIATAIAGIVFGTIAAFFGTTGEPLVAGILGVLTASWVTIVLTLLFFDLRARRGGPGTPADAMPMGGGTPMAAPPPEASWPTTPSAPGAGGS